MEYDVLVVGGGHAGLEASIASAKMGAKTHLLTLLIQNIALASCNPAVGGLGKGHLVKEIDALGGVMGEITDKCGIQFRILNSSKGPAVRGTRAQIDMDRYSIIAKDIALNTPNLTLSQESVESLIYEQDSQGRFIAKGVKTNIGKTYYAKAVILTTGTFLRGLVHIGESKIQNGRFGEMSPQNLSTSLQELGLSLGRLKTGTCARIDGRSIDFSRLETHSGDSNPPHFSHKTKDFAPTQLPCFVTYTNEKTHNIIRSNFHRAPLFTGQIEGVGPRYCPSIEDKINRFADKERHQLFLEPQTQEAVEYYINGLTTSLPIDVQEEMIHSIEGLENAHITRYGYAIEYDYVEPTELYHTLETKKCANLFLAGQINGTTGYEEAAAQGIMAGINAALSLKGESFSLARNEAYIGVMIDDLVTKGTKEPYRVFTSRAEYRLLLREDNAYLRLVPYAFALGLVTKEYYEKTMQDKEHIINTMNYLQNNYLTPSQISLDMLKSLNLSPISDKTLLIHIIGREELEPHRLRTLLAKCGVENVESMSEKAIEQIFIESKYFDYIQKQKEQIGQMEQMLQVEIPRDFVFDKIPGLSLEVIEKLKKFTPKSLFEASEISGITPASIDVLHLYIHLHHKKSALV
ncbi:tRNA uridine 5-carboxymethylaminomethyl modification enzyme [Helicobacter cinaedi CCUG 18818 = ATCC BAA-847]|uniref:tRNA uridine 5-carboxymethylaminomethyl modification enzyme MnmG n=2 Tax=Helicobacter cinaedi TaxID=213 RepID=A0AAI8MMJ9_9HELI|nr:tRNA uridine-5-carboxymethylaminomethyl(34) synthesis enzyme MnmG [Helicobacter cinaedi]EFR46587.1 tRNA uridine 5-carboxymethylaminomethyl modification enzyme GidA [Helicobacter cinaedi CCUG 18818 = ATCC BAA-847]BAM32044.1 tRNA uridine 5-carboxymethylaminomethyl modification enzyme [Helicobacter cinaedi CCUG 18818 = ATCC BAA-847]